MPTSAHAIPPQKTHEELVPPPSTLSLLQRLSRKRFSRWMSDLVGGTIALRDQESAIFGSSDADDLSAEWIIQNPAFYRRLATTGSLGTAESYLRGEWTTSDLTTLLRILCRNITRVGRGTSLLSRITSRAAGLSSWLERNTRRGSRRNIAAHYDLSNEFFELFLDPTLMYSSAYFSSQDMTLEEASRAKIHRICGKLQLQPDDHLLEVGTGWGGFAKEAAEQYGCQITTTTISQAQRTKAAERFKRAGISGQVTLLDSDYRDLNGQYDQIVSIEMVEAVGQRFLDLYFRQLGRLLKPGGRCVIQAIVMPEDRYDFYRRGTDFIRQYIFPGGFLPSVAAIQQSVGRTSQLRMESIEDMSAHYAKTLAEWRTRFFDQLEAVRSLGFDDRFIRMWEYYLCYCEAAFHEQAVRVVQIAWQKPRY